MGKQKNRKNDKQFGNTDFDSLSKQLKQHGLTVNEMVGDGNCLFRALGDQYEGHSRNHIQLRLKVVDYIKSHRDQFEPFIEDDVPFDDHVKNLSEPGTYGGNDAIVAFSRLYNVKIVIHQYNSPAWVIHPSGGGDSKGSSTRPELNISYHNGDHYNSVVKSNGPIEIITKSLTLPNTNNLKNSPKPNKNSPAISKSKSKSQSPSPQPSSVSVSVSNLRIEDLKICDNKDSDSNIKDSEKTEKKENQNPQVHKGKPLSRRQKLDQKKKDRKADSLQRKRGSVGETSVLPLPIAIINTMASIANSHSVKTLNI